MAAAAAVGLAGFAKGLFVSLLAKQLFKPGGDVPLDDSKPATLARLGSRMHLLVGRQRLGPIFAYESEDRRRVILENFTEGGGSKGVGAAGGGSQNRVYLSSGAHILCVGPARRLLRIVWNGETVFPVSGGPGDGGFGISPNTHPSGSTLDVKPTENGKSRGTFTIYWGEPDQPVDEFLALPTELNIRSRFGYTCYVVWQDARIGGAGVWPSIEYDLEVKPYTPLAIHNGGVASVYDTLPTELFPADTAGAVPQNHHAWLVNGEVVDEATCTPILRIEANPLNSVLVEGGFWSFTGERVFVRDSPQGVIDGFLDMTGAVAGPTIVAPINAFVERSQYLSRPDLWFAPPATVVTDLTATGIDPPGRPSGPFGGSGTPDFYVFSIDGAGASIGSGAQISMFPATPGTDPDTGSAGDGRQFNDGFNYFTFYGLAGATATEEGSEVLFGSGGGSSILTLRSSNNAFTTTTAANGAEVFETVLGDGWSRFILMYRAGTGSSVATDNLSLVFRVDTATTNTSATFAMGEASGTVQRVLSYRERTDLATVRLPLDATILQTLDSPLQPLGEICRLTVSELGAQGANAAHIIYQLLFQTEPHGLGHDTECYDLASLQEIAVALSTPGEGLRSHIVLTQGDKLDAALQSLMTEVGIWRVWDFSQGRWAFKLIREEAAILAIPREALTGPRPSIKGKTGNNVVSSFLFNYPDWQRGYRPGLVPGSDDSLGFRDTQDIDLVTVRDRIAAASVGSRMELQETSRPRLRTQDLQGEYYELRVGDVVTFSDTPDGVPMRILTQDPSMDEPRCRFELAADVFSQDAILRAVNAPSNSDIPSNAAPATLVPPDLAVQLWEVSGMLSDMIDVAVFRHPGSANSRQAVLGVSTDDITYSNQGQDTAQAFGTLVAPFMDTFVEAGKIYTLDKGPIIRSTNTTFGQDTDELSDADWRVGEQWLYLNGEIMYVREFVSLGDDVYQAEGVLRARFDTPLSDSAMGDYAFVLKSLGANTFHSDLAARGFPLYVKAMPSQNGVTQSAATVTAQALTPTGKGLRPMPVSLLRTHDFTSSYVNKAQVTFKWNPIDPRGRVERTGFGMQGLGEATSTGVFPGTFRVIVQDTGGGTLEALQTIPGTQTEITYTGNWNKDVDFSIVPVYATGEAGDRQTLRVTVVV